MELHTNRAAKHRYGKQRCKTSNITVSYENMNLQIPSMFDAEPASAELNSPRKRFAKQPFHPWNTQASNPTPWKRMAPRHERPTTHIPLKKNCAARKQRQFNLARRDAKTSKSETAEKNGPPPPADKKTTYIAHEDPAYTHKATSTTTAIDIGVVFSNLHVPKKLGRSRCAL